MIFAVVLHDKSWNTSSSVRTDKEDMGMPWWRGYQIVDYYNAIGIMEESLFNPDARHMG